MQKLRYILTLLAGLGLVALIGAGCAPQSPEERVAAQRSRYTASLNAFIVKETPIAAPEPAVEEGEGEPADEPAADDPEAAAVDDMEEPVAVRQDVELDLLVQHDLDEALPGLTVDVTMVSADKVEKGHWRVWVETAGLPKANHKQVSHVLEDVDYVEGDGFYAEVRHPVPPEERGDYREFGAAGS